MTPKKLLEKVLTLKSSRAREIVNRRMSEFLGLGKKDDKAWFSELSFCILTANSTAKLGMKIQDEMGPDGFLALPRSILTAEFKRAGHRFYNKRAEFIVNARKFRNIKEIATKFPDEQAARDWLAKNVDGIGYKEASHFLRNVGYGDVAILDRHILALMREHGLLERPPRTLTRKRYLQIEEKLRELARKANLSLAELDLYLWYMKTGEILK